MLEEPARVAAPWNGVTPVGLEIGAELDAPATPGTGEAGAGAGAGAPVAAACAGAGVPATRPTLEEAPVLKATCGRVTWVESSWVVVQAEGMPVAAWT